MQQADIEGERFGKLLATRFIGSLQWHGRVRRIFWFRCDCGKECAFARDAVANKSGRRSCGCARFEVLGNRTRTHGESGHQRSVEYRLWRNIKSRCLNPSVRGFSDYGGRGITIHQQWRDNFLAFLAYVGRKPADKHSLDRINNDGNYEPGNVRWATAKDQANNRRKAKCRRQISPEHTTLPECKREASLPVSRATP